MENRSDALWQSCLLQIQDKIPADDFKIWLYPLQAEATAESLLLYASNAFVQKWVIDNYLPLILDVARQASANSNLNVSVIEGIKPTALKVEKPMKKQSAVGFSEEKSTNKTPYHSNLNTKLVFENFVEGKSNQLARAVAQKVADNPGEQTSNPLFLYGGTGLGKTHLAHAIGVDIKEKYPKKKVLYVSAEKFTQQFISASTAKDKDKNTLNDFIHFYQLIDVLIVDDIQFLSGKVKTQDAFFHIFNHLHQNGKQVILTSDKAPVDLFDIEQRLLSRFKWGLSAELQTPDYETRYKILENKFYNDGAEIGEDIIAYLAENIRTNVRELEGVSNSLIAQAAFNRKEYSIELAQSIIDKSVKNNRNDLTIDHIQQIIADYFGLDIESLHSKTRKRNVVQARQLAMFFSKKYTKNSLSTIGSQIGQRDHATVLHACKTVENLIETDRAFKKYVSDLETKFSD